MNTARRDILRLAAASAVGLTGQKTHAQPNTIGVTATDIKVGQSVALTGGSAALGQQLAEGTRACFEAINKRGGIRGRRIVLKTLDDAYEPARTLSNTQQLIQECFLLTGYYGTPTIAAVSELLQKESVPMVGFVSGATVFRTPMQRMLFNVRASYNSEIEKMIEHNRSIGIERFAIIYQDDSFGKPCLETAEKALAVLGLKPVATAPIVRNATDANLAAKTIASAKPQTVLVFTTLSPTVLFIKAMRELQSAPQYMLLSPIGADTLSKQLAGDARGIGIAQVFPQPEIRTIPIVAEYQSAMKQHSSIEPSYYSLEGYLNAKVIATAINRMGNLLSREGFTRALESAEEINLGGFFVRYSATSREGSRFVELTVIGSGGKVLR